VLVALVGSTVPSAIAFFLALRIISYYYSQHPGGDPLDRIGEEQVLAIVVGLIVEAVAGVVIFRRLPK
jgi:hypothetical protein